jgi:hypothetical protein
MTLSFRNTCPYVTKCWLILPTTWEVDLLNNGGKEMQLQCISRMQQAVTNTFTFQIQYLIAAEIKDIEMLEKSCASCYIIRSQIFDTNPIV